MNARAAHVAIDQKNPATLLREHNRSIDTGRGLALLRQSARDQDDLGG